MKKGMICFGIIGAFILAGCASTEPPQKDKRTIIEYHYYIHHFNHDMTKPSTSNKKKPIRSIDGTPSVRHMNHAGQMVNKPNPKKK